MYERGTGTTRDAVWNNQEVAGLNLLDKGRIQKDL